MQTLIIAKCIAAALKDKNVRKAVKKREAFKKTRAHEVKARILKRKKTNADKTLLVRVGLDYQTKEDLTIKEDILVDVVYKLNIKTSVETYTVGKPISVPEI